jgi:hypothetical protein
MSLRSVEAKSSSQVLIFADDICGASIVAREFLGLSEESCVIELYRKAYLIDAYRKSFNGIPVGWSSVRLTLRYGIVYVG